MGYVSFALPLADSKFGITHSSSSPFQNGCEIKIRNQSLNVHMAHGSYF